MNDKLSDPKTGLKYSQITLNDAKRIGDNLDKLDQYNVTTIYGRNQRGKGRHIMAVSRIVNLVLNRLESQEIEAYKNKSVLFTGYSRPEVLKVKLIEQQKYAESHGLAMAN